MRIHFFSKISWRAQASRASCIHPVNIRVKVAFYAQDDDNAGKDQRDLFRDLSFSFSCDGKLPGFYADVTYDCKIFHVCTENGDRLPILCPFKTLFDQRQRMCTDEEDVPCEESERW